MNKYEIGENIKNLRKQNHMDQKTLAQKLNISVPLLSMWECGNRTTPNEYLDKICFVFKCPKAAIIGSEKISIKDKKLNILLSIFDNLSEDMQDLLLVRAKELEYIDKEKYERNIA